MTRAPLVVASALAAGTLLAMSWLPTAEPATPSDPRLGTLSNSSHDMPSAKQRLDERGFDVSTSGLLSLADDPSADLGDRYNALIALGEIDGPEADAVLIRALGEYDADLRYAAVVAFRDRGDRMAERAVLSALDDPAEDVRSIAIASLATVGGPLAARTLAGRLAGGLLDGYQAVDAAVTLGELGQPSAAPALSLALADSLAADCPPAMQAAASRARHHDAAKRRDELPIAVGCSAARSSEADLRAAIGGALARLGQPSTSALVLGALDPCTSDWLRTDVVDRLTKIADRPFAPIKRRTDGEPTTEILQDVAAWWRQR
ncbi:MAG: HEAT repeat domain-containing protein [Acidobacteriota bacterium]